MIQCEIHGVKELTLTTPKLYSLINSNTSIDEIKIVRLDFDGIKLGFFSDIDTAKKVKWKSNDDYISMGSDIEDWEEFIEGLKPVCMDCFRKYIHLIKPIPVDPINKNI